MVSLGPRRIQANSLILVLVLARALARDVTITIREPVGREAGVKVILVFVWTNVFQLKLEKLDGGQVIGT